MANTIKQKRGTTNPSASDLVVGELAINTTDGGLFTKTDGGTVVEIGSADVVDDTSPQLGGNLDVNGNEIISTSNGDITINPNGTGDVVLDAKLNVEDFSTFTLNTNTIDYTVFLRGGDTAGEGNYGASLGFGRINSSGRTGAVIATKQTSTDADQQGISFLTHTSANTDSDLIESMLITHDGKVGIQTTDIDGQLEVRSSGALGIVSRATSTQSTASNKAFKARNNSDTDTFSVSYSGQGYYAGYLGVGTSDPARPLHIESSLNNPVRIASSATYSRIEFESSASTDPTNVAIGGSGDDFRIFTGTNGSNSTRLIVDSSGNVGIGSTTAAEKLDVSGDVAIRGTQPALIFDETDTDTTARLTVAGGDLYIQSGAAGSGPASSAGDIRFTGYNAQNVVEFQIKYDGSYQDIWHAGNDGAGSGLDADFVDGIQASSFLRSDVNDTASGVVTFNGDVLIRTALDFADGDVLRMGSSDDWTVTYNSNGWNYINQKQNGIIFQDNGTNIARLEDSAVFRPENNYGGQIGSTTRRWNAGYFRYCRGQSSGSPGLNNTTVGFAMDNAGVGYFSRSNNLAVSANRNSNGTVINLARSGSQKGNIQVTTSGATFNSASDYRLKENVVALSNGIARLKQLSPSRFNFIEEPSITVDGFIAHEAQTVVPEAVTGTQDEVEAIGTLTEYDGTVLETNTPQPDSLTWEETLADEDGNETTHVRTRTWVKTSDQPVYQGIDQSKLVPLLTAALQEAIAKIESLETQNADLLARVTALESS